MKVPRKNLRHHLGPEPAEQYLEELFAALRENNDWRGVLERGFRSTIDPWDLQVWIERWRAVNDVTNRSEVFESQCGDALDYLHGQRTAKPERLPRSLVRQVQHMVDWARQIQEAIREAQTAADLWQIRNHLQTLAAQVNHVTWELAQLEARGVFE